jgi:hypothetical protein
LAEGLGRYIKRSRTVEELQGLKITPNSEALTHLQFMDDTLLLGKPTVKEARLIRKNLNLFMAASGMEINDEKSKVYFLNTPISIQRNISRFLGFQRASLPSSYLGLPLLEKSPKASAWKELLSKIDDRLNSWSHHFLSFPARILLIKSVLSAMPLYLFSVLAAPTTILQQLRAIQWKFL